VTKKR